MSYQTIDTLIINSGIDISSAVDKIDAVFENEGLSLSLNDTFWLEDFLEFDSPESGEYDIKARDEAKAFLDRLKNHRAGGTISYVDENMTLPILVAFTSLNDMDICAIKMYVQSDIAELHRKKFRLLITNIKSEIGALAILQGSQLNPRWDEEPLIEAVLQGNTPRYTEFILETEPRTNY